MTRKMQKHPSLANVCTPQVLSIYEHIARMGGDRALAMQAYQTAETKADGSFVTQADKEVEALIRNALQKEFPTHLITGEEGEKVNPLIYPTRLCDIIDPIDGTRYYKDKEPRWSTAIAMTQGNVPLLGVVYNPATKELFSGYKGMPIPNSSCTLNGDNSQNSEKKIPKFAVYFKPEEPHKDLLTTLRKAQDRGLILLDEQKGSPSYLLSAVSQNIFDVTIIACRRAPEPEDFAAAAVILESSGNLFCNLQGEQINPYQYSQYVVGCSSTALAYTKYLLTQIDKRDKERGQ